MSLPRVGQVIASKYELARMIARGGMGSVWEAKHISLGTPVAVKFMDPMLAESADLRGRFEREARAAARLHSPHVVQVHDHGVDESGPYIVMELLHGEDLRARLRRGRLDLNEASHLATQAAKALRAAHSAGIVHRDLKPANVFLVRTDDDDEVLVKLLDFGIAKGGDVSIDPAESTVTGQLLGSPEYMSPEQARSNKGIDPRSDLWSFGVILYRAVTGAKPFSGEGMGDLFVKICTEPTRPPSSHDPTLPLELDAFFDKALAKDPDARFQSAREMAASFAQIAGARAGGAPRTATLADETEARLQTVPEPSSSMRTLLPMLPGGSEGAGGHAVEGETLAASSAPRRVSAQPRGLSRRTWGLVGASSVALGGITTLIVTTDRSPGFDPASSRPALTASASTAPPALDVTSPAVSPTTVDVSPSAAPSGSARASAAGTGGARLVAPLRPAPGKPKAKPNFGY